MDFDDTPEEQAFRAEARAWLEANVPVDEDASGAAAGPFAEEQPEQLARSVAAQKRWQATLFDGGWAGITWPEEYGGRGGSAIHQIIFNEESSRAGAPGASIFTIGLGMVGPTIIRHGSAEQRERFLRPMLRGEEVWCQLFSEPGAGSDLASLRTRAERDGDEWVVNGQKVWTSGAHYREFGMLLARTNPSLPKHGGITCFLVDMGTPGIEPRPLRQMTGGAGFNEVFLTDVRLPLDSVLGDVGEGWAVARTTLMNERVALGGGGGGEFGRLVDLAGRVGATSDPVVRQRLAAVYARGQVLRYLGLRVRSALSRGEAPGPEGAVAKLAAGMLAEETGDLALSMLGPAASLAGADAPDGGGWQLQRLGAPALRIAGGTDEIMRSMIGERMLGLPREPAADRDVPFDEAQRAASALR